MKIHYFFRRPSPVFHSIEEQFFAVQKALPPEITYKNVFAKYHSKGLLRRLGIALRAALRQGDVNHITGDINFIAIFLTRGKTILTIHDIGSVLTGSKLKLWAKRFFWYYLPFRSVKYITVISEFSKKEIIQKLKVTPNKIVVIPDCFSPVLMYSPKEFATEKPVLLQMGTKPNKNLTRIIDALYGIKCKLLIVGKLSEEQKQHLQDAKIDYENKFNLPYENIVNLYKRSDIVLFASLYEGFGVPVIEANAIGRPVITSNISPLKEVAGNSAYFVNPYEGDQIRQAIGELISDQVLRKQLVEKGLTNAKRYTAKAVAQQYLNLYKSL